MRDHDDAVAHPVVGQSGRPRRRRRSSKRRLAGVVPHLVTSMHASLGWRAPRTVDRVLKTRPRASPPCSPLPPSASRCWPAAAATTSTAAWTPAPSPSTAGSTRAPASSASRRSSSAPTRTGHPRGGRRAAPAHQGPAGRRRRRPAVTLDSITDDSRSDPRWRAT